MGKQIFGSSLSRPWALVRWNAGSTPGRRPATTVVYLTDDCGDHYLGGLVEFYRKNAVLRAVRNEGGKIMRYDTAIEADQYPRWHFRFSRPRKFLKSEIVTFFPNGKSRDQGPHKSQIAAAKRTVPKNEDEHDEARAA